MMDYAMILTVIGLLTVLVNLIVQVVKPLTYDKVPTEILATVAVGTADITGVFRLC